MEDDDSEFDDLDVNDEVILADAEGSPPAVTASQRPRRNWRDIERMREQRELDGLQRRDAWFEELERV